MLPQSPEPSPPPTPPPPPPPLPRTPTLTPSPRTPPPHARTGSDASLDSDDVVNAQVGGKKHLYTTVAPTLHDLHALHDHHTNTSPTTQVSPSTSDPPLPSTSTASATASETASPTPSDTSDACPSSPSTPSIADDTDDGTASTCSVNTDDFLNDIGWPIVHDPDDWKHLCVSRLDITRTYASSEDDTLKRKPSGAFSDEPEEYEEWAHIADDMLSLEEMQEEAERIADAIDNTALPNLPRENPPRRQRPPPPSRSTLPVINLNDDDNDNDDLQISDEDTGHAEPVVMPVSRTMPEVIALPPAMTSAAHLANANCTHVTKMRDRVAHLTQALGSLQMTTAARAADADVHLGHASEKTADGQLKGEVSRLRITLDHIARLCLEQAFAIRDQLDEHG